MTHYLSRKPYFKKGNYLNYDDEDGLEKQIDSISFLEPEEYSENA